ncbi:MAG TPA: cation:proton antiporter [Stellaceae bacterium]
MDAVTAFLVDALFFALAPWAAWRLLRRSVPLAVLPILFGVAVSALGVLLGTSGKLVTPSGIGELIGQLGVLLLAFTAGLENGIDRMGGGSDDQAAVSASRQSMARTYVTAALALIVPFAAGMLISYTVLWNVPAWAANGIDRFIGSASIGLCVAVSALPVLVGIVRELPWQYRSTGRLALRIAVIDDGVLWTGLGVLLAVADVGAGWGHWTALDLGAFAVLVALFAVGRLANTAGWLRMAALSWIIGAVYLALGSWATSRIGLHPLLGAYFAGAVLPAGAIRRLPVERLGFMALVLLAPFYFGHRGLSVDGHVLTWATLASALGLLVLSASTKIAVVAAVPPLPDISRREALGVGCLLQCKGLMEIVAASILRDQGLVSEMAYAVLIVLALLSTLLTAPMFYRAMGRSTARPMPAPVSTQQLNPNPAVRAAKMPPTG